MDKQLFHAFTTKYNGIARQLNTPVSFSLPYDPNNQEEPQEFTNTQAIWDTGATSSVITKSFAKKLGLKPIGKINVRGVNGDGERNVYLVNIGLPNKVIISYVKVTESDDLVGEAEALIGMDIIGSGDFSVTNVDGKTLLSFRIPSIKEIDYVEEAKNIRIKKGIQSQEKNRKAVKRKRKQQRQNKKKSKKR